MAKPTQLKSIEAKHFASQQKRKWRRSSWKKILLSCFAVKKLYRIISCSLNWLHLEVPKKRTKLIFVDNNWSMTRECHSLQSWKLLGVQRRSQSMKRIFSQDFCLLTELQLSSTARFHLHYKLMPFNCRDHRRFRSFPLSRSTRGIMSCNLFALSTVAQELKLESVKQRRSRLILKPRRSTLRFAFPWAKHWPSPTWLATPHGRFASYHSYHSWNNLVN